MSKKFLLAIAFVFSFLFTQATFADSSICRESLSKMVQSLNLDANQKSKVNSILDQLKSNMKATGTQMDGLEDQITQQTYSANMDQNNANSVVDQKTKLIGDMMKARITATNQIYNILNPQQQAKFKSMMKTADDKMAAMYKNCDQD